MKTCNDCGREVRWIETVSGQVLPLDPAPLPDGTIMILPTGRARVVAIEDRKACVAPLYRSHYASCDMSPAKKARA